MGSLRRRHRGPDQGPAAQRSRSCASGPTTCPSSTATGWPKACSGWPTVCRIWPTTGSCCGGPSSWAAANWLLDAACLLVFIAAFHDYVSPINLLVAYGLANILAVIPITPGGLGIIEGILIPALHGFGVPLVRGRRGRPRLPAGEFLAAHPRGGRQLSLTAFRISSAGASDCTEAREEIVEHPSQQSTAAGRPIEAPAAGRSRTRSTSSRSASDVPGIADVRRRAGIRRSGRGDRTDEATGPAATDGTAAPTSPTAAAAAPKSGRLRRPLR